MTAAKKTEEVEAVTLDTLHPLAKTLIESAITQRDALAVLVNEIESAEGQQSVILKNAGNEILGQNIPADSIVSNTLLSVVTFGDLAEWLDTANKWAAEVFTMKRDALIKSRSQGSDTGAALREKYKSDKEALQAILAVLTGPTITPLGEAVVAFVNAEVAKITVPDRRSKSVGSDGVTKKRVQYGRTLADGTDRPMSEAQNTNSHMRQQFLKKLTDADLDINGWRNYIRENGNPNYSGNADEYSVTDASGVKYWARHIDVS